MDHSHRTNVRIAVFTENWQNFILTVEKIDVSTVLFDFNKLVRFQLELRWISSSPLSCAAATYMCAPLLLGEHLLAACCTPLRRERDDPGETPC